MAENDRDILFSNEAFLIGILQAVSGGGLVAGIAQAQSLKNLSGARAYFIFLTAMTVALLIAVIAAWLKHQYKMWDVKARVSATQGSSDDVRTRTEKATLYLRLMRSAFVVSLVGLFIGIGILVVAFSLSASKVEASASSASGARPNEAIVHDNWQRAKDCAEQTDRILKRSHLELGQTIGNEDSVGQSENHYSLKHEKCFVQVGFFTSLHTLRGLPADLRKSTPTTYWMLYDAFEGKELTTCTFNRVENFCSIGAHLQLAPSVSSSRMIEWRIEHSLRIPPRILDRMRLAQALKPKEQLHIFPVPEDSSVDLRRESNPLNQAQYKVRNPPISETKND